MSDASQSLDESGAIADMDADADLAVKAMLRDLNARLRPLGFKRRGHSFGRETPECWQILQVQVSRYSSLDEKSLTVNIGVQSKELLRFRAINPATPPSVTRILPRSRLPQ